MTSPTMAAGFAAAFLDYAVEKGADRAALLCASTLSEDVLKDQDTRIPVSAYQTLIGSAIQATGDTALLLRHTFESKLETISVVGQIVHRSASLGHSIDQLNRYLRLMAEVDSLEGRDRFELLDSGGQVWIVDHMPVANSEYIGMEASFARFISEFRHAFPSHPFALEMEVSFSPPPHVDVYPDLFRIPVRFNTSRNALRIERAWIEAQSEFEPGNRYAFGIFTRHADDLLTEISRSETIRAKVEGRILPDLHEGSLSMDNVARDLGMSRQTLYRRLKDEAVTFAEVHDGLRHRMALDYLTTRKVSVSETAYLLGFSEASSFVRAFRRWTGKSPTAYRDDQA
ncbi:Virulence-regulating protein VirS [Thalassovita gelatinovora]|uniref:Virulence-regulating protein VirS n=1 Tax=Thalassovita gelatinovora TaxID=53501 RepID=A0A0P1FI33_THAGE|nr:AraC family transcriptional regulator [Thalassovita gelatinovora]QIZ82017.1 AraC family transcriptional regulator [Thalassovita gelatinovora]CUH67484.1 Virulence-regulating protein VirS [Thalassovita gelatinovora]SEP73164.1 transcriptional regulator, AraC family [Thalassovita gelatinovora]